MKNKNGLSIKKIMATVLPIGVCFLMMSIGVLLVTNRYSTGTIDYRVVLLLIMGAGFIFVMISIALASQARASRMTVLIKATSELASGNPEIPGIIKDQDDQFDKLSLNLVEISENIRRQAIMMEKIKDGELGIEIPLKSEKDLIGKSLHAFQSSFVKIMDEIVGIIEYTELKSSFLIEKEKSEKISCDFQSALSQAVKAVKLIREERDYFLDILDSLPYRIKATDNDMKQTFINSELEKIMKQLNLIEKREECYGLDCSSSNLQMCNTENCGIRALKERGIKEYPFEVMDRHFRMDTAYIENKSGKNIGFLEISHDTTATMSINTYMRDELARLAENLNHLVAGDLNLNTNIKEATEYTQAVHDQFKAIENNLEQVKETIGDLIDDAMKLSVAAVKGQLENRIDIQRFEGSWRELISGMNNILAEISKPVNEVAEVMAEVAQGNLSVMVIGSYEGRFNQLKDAVNNMSGRLKSIIDGISDITGEIGKGNLNIEDASDFGGDFDMIACSLNHIILKLNALLGDINNAAGQVNSGASQVSAGSQSLAQGSTEQASSIEELTASINEIAAKIKNNAIDANHVREQAGTVMENAKNGKAQMLAMQHAMEDINQSSKEISKIIKVIDDIAFQTNILALNAAVEAARAGQHGKGFAVVAEEVRSLAARSADAAKETTNLIEGSINKVEIGRQMVDETSFALGDIVSGIDKVSDLIGNIAKASNDQATGIAQINIGIDQVAQVVQQNSATAEESAASSEELTSQSVLLKNLIDQFELRNQ